MTDEVITPGSDNVAPPAAGAPPKETYTKEYVHDLREESKAQRLKYQALEKDASDKIAAAEAAAVNKQKELELSFSEKEKSFNARLIKSDLKTYALSQGINDLDDLKLVDMSSITINEDGEVEGSEDVINALKEKKPYLFKEYKSSAYTGKTPEKDKAKENAKKGVFGLSNEDYEKQKRTRAWRN